MQNHFQETFEIIKGSDLIRQAERVQQGREPELFPLDCRLAESIRPEGRVPC